MPPLKSILVLVDRSADAQVALQKAFVIARHFGADIELVACDAEQAWMARLPGRAGESAQARAARSAESRRFLEALRSTILVDDLQIRIGADCEGPLHEALPSRVQAAGHHLVVKRLPWREARHRPALTSVDWQLIRASPVPVMLTRGRPWRPLPRIVASVDGAAADELIDAARFLADGCQGVLEVVHENVQPQVAAGGGSGAAVRGGVGGGQALWTTPASQETDVVVLRACGHRPDEDESRERLTARIVEQLDCDVLLLPCPLRH